MRLSLRTCTAFAVASLVATALAACGGSTQTEPLRPGTDGGTRSDSSSPRRDAPAAPDGPPACNLVQIVYPILTVTDALTHAKLCDAVGSAPAGVSLGACSGAGCQSTTCLYNVLGLQSDSTTTITVTAPGYASATVAAANSFCGCNSGACGADEVTVALTPEVQPVDAGPPPSRDAGPPGKLCPAVAPSESAPCPLVSLECEYGASPNPSCNQLWTCEASGWQSMSTGGICPPPGATCPPTYAKADNLTCTTSDLSLLCEYPQGTCVCSQYGGGIPRSGPPAFSCTPTTPGCPAAPPPLGSTCAPTTPSECDYGACSGGVAEACQDGHWALAKVPCPV